MGEEYSQWTVVGFFATVFFAFIVFLPAGTLFAARAEFAKDKVEVRDNEKTGATAPIAHPLLETAPSGVASAAAGTAIAYMLVYWGGWMPSPLVTTLVSLVFVVPYAGIVRQNIFGDIEGLTAQGAFHGKPVASKTRHALVDLCHPEPDSPADHQPSAGLQGLFARRVPDPGQRRGRRAGGGAGTGLRHHVHVRLQLHLPGGDGAYGVGYV